ncbi:TIGR04338 family metallohydrolase [Rhodococcus triatomae]|uniref:Putative metallohydrolase, TIGR04338 family n=1 Tax=Rhodococcus triatomae TaxID=300028 RepID=A0A1G8QME9_9NOCA|nr:TIGR04338 family metallohydrolase [Rhodococcus triatomae]QNG20625.1 TIGR04338 family metallohydrolase [Rhodococcus triatomae]QNG23457.1 TIGR04338 family metallohydrolase [Rhodococcus triatomae]SDJ05969.1 putative metallohydrolase, TIGR04338 family [Rhodococcus triatomae]
MRRGRDTQRSAVYDAEALVRTMFDRADERGLRTVEVLGSHVTLPIERKFASIDSVQAYVDRVLALNWVRAKWTRAEQLVRVRARAGNAAAHYESDCATIAVPEHHHGAAWAFRELVVLHELAHHLDPTDPESPTTAPHGPEYVDRYLTLVGEIIGPEAAFVLRATFLAGGVRVG